MAKKKGGQQTEAVKSVSTDVQLPARPQRQPGARAPGVPVELVTNLFRVSLKSEKPIYCHTIQIDSIDNSKSGDVKKPSLPRKIPKDLRQQAVTNAIQQWIKNNQASKTAGEPLFVLDSNASTMYSLFMILDLHDGSPGTRKHKEIIVTIESPKIVDKKVKMESEQMAVHFYAPSLVDVRGLVDHCAGKKPRASAEVEATLKSLNVILTGKILHAPNYLGMQAKSGSCSVFNYERKNQFQVSPGVICNRGFITSVRTTENGLVANVANSVVPFYEPLRLLDLLERRFQVRKDDFSKGLPQRVIDDLKKELYMKQVEAMHINYGTKEKPHYRKYRVHGIGEATTDMKFELEDPKTKVKSMVSVYDYFKKEYPNCKLLYPKLPCIVDNKRLIPLEICRLVDKQKVNRRLTPLETSNVIKEAALKPEKHFEHVRQNAADLGNYDDYFKKFGLEFDRKLIELTGRELPQIKLHAANRFSLNTRDGAYDAFRPKFVASPDIKKWALIVLADERFKRNFQSPQQCSEECFRFARNYCKSGRDKGVKITDLASDGLRFISISMSLPDQQIKKMIRDEFVRLNKDNYTHAIFVLPAIKDWIYGYLQYLEVDVPKKTGKAGPCARTSCIKDENFVRKILRGDERSMGMFLSNLWLKYNTKFGGVNFVLDANQNFGIDQREFTNANNFLQPGFLFVSIDVCHPAPGDKLEQSVAAAVGMWNITNPNMATCTRVRVQRKESSDKEKSTVEQVGEIGLMFGEILESYKKKMNGKVPTHIVVLRDGVSDGQFHMVLRYELSQVKARIKMFYGNLKLKEPLLACLTVQKRHRTRFMRKNPVQTRKGPDYNIQPGTVVDNQIVEPLHHSFYLAPHKAIQGTARAPHVYMIYDEIRFSQDSAQAMIFSLSYLSPRCTKGTSIPTPVNLADLAAERGKHIVVSWNEDNSQKMSTEDRLSKLNAFLSNMGDASYQDTLYYV